MQKTTSILQMFPQKLRLYFEQATEYEDLAEIRIRCRQPVMLRRGRKEYYLAADGTMQEERPKECLVFNVGQVESIFVHLCQYSPYAYGEELRQGFITVAGGHRIGVSGQVLSENKSIRSIRNIRFLNMRISHEVKGAADAVLPFIMHKDMPCNTMLIAGPGMGKTTLLRDLIRQLSDGFVLDSRKIQGYTVGVVDERSEIAGCFLGEPQNDVGMRTDVLDNCPKDAGMEMLLRSMAPQILAVDEIATERDVQTLQKAMHCGTKVLATVHGTSFAELEKKPFLQPLLHMQEFTRFIVLKGQGTSLVYNEKGEQLL